MVPAGDVLVVEQLLERAEAERLVEHELTLNASPEALDELAKLGYDPEMGARPLRRALQKFVESPLSVKLLGGEFVPGDTIRVEVDTEEDTLVCEKTEAIPAEELAEELNPVEAENA